jgi:hypothetical protein
MLDAFSTAIARARLQDRFANVSANPTLQEWKRQILDIMSGSATEELKANTILQRDQNQNFFQTEEGYYGMTGSDIRAGKTNTTHHDDNIIVMIYIG